jgi:hypothetical protein
VYFVHTTYHTVKPSEFFINKLWESAEGYLVYTNEMVSGDTAAYTARGGGRSTPGKLKKEYGMKIEKIWRLALVGWAALAGCGLPVGENYVLQNKNALMIGEYNLEAYVPAPVAGAPVVVLKQRGDMEIQVVWKELSEQGQESKVIRSDNFEAGKVYQADITITAKNRWSFDPEIDFRYSVGLVTTQPESNLDPMIRNLTPVTYKLTGDGYEQKEDKEN